MRLRSSSAVAVLLLLLLSIPSSEAAVSGLEFSTYLGGKDADQFADMAINPFNGDIYVIGTTTPTHGDFPTLNPLELCKEPNRGGPDPRKLDLFIARFSKAGYRISSTYFGGEESDYAKAVAVGNDCVYVAGTTEGASSNWDKLKLPTTAGAYMENGRGIFISKFNLSCNAILSSTLIQGTDVEDMAVDNAGCPIVVGYWNGGDFTTTQNAYQKEPKGGGDGIIVKLSPDLKRVEYASYLGGKSEDYIHGITKAPDGAFYVTGETKSSNFPSSPDSFQPDKATGDNSNGFVTRFSSDWAFENSTLLGAWSLDGLKANAASLQSVATDSSGNVYVAGRYMRNSIDGSGQQHEAFAAKLSPRLGDLFYYKPLYGLTPNNGFSNAYSIAVDENGSAHVAGMTKYDDFPAVNQYQGSRAGGQDVFLTKLSPDGEFIAYSTYLGGGADDYRPAAAIAPDGNTVVAGKTKSPDFPVGASPSQQSFGGAEDAFLSALITEPGSSVNGANLSLLLSSPRLRSGDLLSMSISLGKSIDTAFDAYLGVQNNTTKEIASILLNGYVDDGLFPCARGVKGLKGPVLHSVWKNMAVTPSLAGSWTLYVVTTDPGRLPEGVGSVEDLKAFEKLGQLPKFAQTIYTIDCVLSASGVR